MKSKPHKSTNNRLLKFSADKSWKMLHETEAKTEKQNNGILSNS